MKSKFPALFLFLVMFLAGPPLLRAGDDAVRILDEIPVQHAGRIKPFQSFAQEAVLYVTGRQHFGGEDPSRLVWRWMAFPEKGLTAPLIPVSYQPLREDFKLMLVNGRISPEIALNHQPFLQAVQEAAMKRERKDKLSELEKKRLEVYEKALFYRAAAFRTVPGVIAHPENPAAGWLPLESIASEEGRKILAQFFPAENVEALRLSFEALLESAKTEGGIGREQAEAFRGALENMLAAGGVILDEKVIQTEVRYNRLKPFHFAWIFYFLSFVISLPGGALKKNAPAVLARVLNVSGLLLFIAGFAIHAYGFYLRCIIAGRPPVSNMYESMIWVSWAVALFALVLYGVYRRLVIRNTAALVAGFALLLAEQFPVALNPAISPLVPVLRSNLWLTVHVLTITLSYGAFALAWGLGHAVLFQFAFRPDARETQRALSQFLYRAIQIGVVLLAAGTILGGVWANYSWGRFWGWDPKETWALIALLGYLAVLHGRFAGWLGPFGTAVGSVAAFLGVVMAWYGVNFVLAAGLHSYGFGGGGIGYVTAAVLADAAAVGAMAWLYKKKKQLSAAGSWQ